MNAHPKPSVVNDDGQRRIARDEPSVPSEQPQPGAFPIPGSDGRRRNGNSRSGSRGDASLEAGDREPPVVHPRRRAVLRNDNADSATVLVPEANLVTSGDDVSPGGRSSSHRTVGRRAEAIAATSVYQNPGLRPRGCCDWRRHCRGRDTSDQLQPNCRIVAVPGVVAL